MAKQNKTKKSSKPRVRLSVKTHVKPGAPDHETGGGSASGSGSSVAP
jgi:hypothetical protein